VTGEEVAKQRIASKVLLDAHGIAVDVEQAPRPFDDP
jgi:hypothetical protein